MTLADIVAAIIDVGDKIDVLWNIFIAAHFGIFSLYYVTSQDKYPLKWSERLVMSGAYSIFLYLNGNALRKSYEFLDALDQEVRIVIQDPESKLNILEKYFLDIDYSGRPGLVLYVHVAAFVVVVFGILLRPQSLKLP